MPRMDIRKILARNVSALMRRSTDLKTPRKLAPHCSTATRKIGARTIAHLLKAEGSYPQIDTIAAIADAFKVPTWMLLYPNFDPDNNPPEGRLPPEVIALAQRIMENREVITDVFGADPISDAKLESNGFKAPSSHAVHQKKTEYTTRQTKIKIKR